MATAFRYIIAEDKGITHEDLYPLLQDGVEVVIGLEVVSKLIAFKLLWVVTVQTSRESVTLLGRFLWPLMLEVANGSHIRVVLSPAAEPVLTTECCW